MTRGTKFSNCTKSTCIVLFSCIGECSDTKDEERCDDTFCHVFYMAEEIGDDMERVRDKEMSGKLMNDEIEFEKIFQNRLPGLLIDMEYIFEAGKMFDIIDSEC